MTPTVPVMVSFVLQDCFMHHVGEEHPNKIFTLVEQTQIWEREIIEIRVGGCLSCEWPDVVIIFTSWLP